MDLRGYIAYEVGKLIEKYGEARPPHRPAMQSSMAPGGLEIKEGIRPDGRCELTIGTKMRMLPIQFK
jgi:hypothetical protein